MKMGSHLKRLACVAVVSASMVGLHAGRADAAAPPVPAPATSGVLVGAAAGIIGVAAFLGIYDLVRRSGCTGDVLKLGGPGFGQPIRPSDNVMPPQNCRR